MGHTKDVILGLVAVVWEGAPFVLISAAWWRWGKAQQPRDLPFILGASLATLSCCEIVPFWIPVTTRWGQLRVDVISYGALVAVLCTIAALVILPFATLKAKWLAFTSSAVTLLFVAMFLLSLST